MIEFHRVTFTYPDGARPALRDVDIEVSEGELALVVGATGSGKSTLLRAVNGLVPRFSGGNLAGRVVTAGRSTDRTPVREMAETVGMVPQDPATGFVTETVEEELAYTMEQLGLAPPVMRKRLEEILDLMGLAGLRSRPLSTLSGGEAQRVAIGSVLTAHPPVMVLDEPTSALDPAAAEEVLSSLTRLVHDVGITVLVAEHRLERVVQYADQVIHLDARGRVTMGDPKTVMEHSTVAPPVVHLARLLGWSPPPLTVRDARRRSADLRSRLSSGPPSKNVPPPDLATVERLSVWHGSTPAVRDVSLSVGAGEVVALMGRNGAGKSSLLWAIQGSGPRRDGRVLVAGEDPAGREPRDARRLVGLVPHNPADLLFMETVAQECDRADHTAAAPAGTCRALLARLVDGIEETAHPSDLSEGEKLALVLAIQLSARPRLLLLDEPTRGLDYGAKERLGSALGDLAAAGTGVVVATHDVEFVAAAAHRVVVLADGEVVADGPTPEVVVASPVFAPQISKVMAPEPWLTTDEVAACLDST